MNRSGYVVLQKHAVGWTTLNLFAHDLHNLSDVSSEGVPVGDPLNESLRDKTLRLSSRPGTGNARSQVHGRDLMCGSPLLLVYLPRDQTQWHKKLRVVDNCKLHFRCYKYEAMSAVEHMFRDNELLGCHDPIGGLPLRDVGDGTTEPKCLPFNPRDLALYKLPRITIRVSHPTILLPPGYEVTRLEILSPLFTSARSPSHGRICRHNALTSHHRAPCCPPWNICGCIL